MNHLINTEDFSLFEIEQLFERAAEFLDEKPRDILQNKIVITIFLENTTRTRSRFEIAVKRLSTHTISLDVSKRSSSKGEILFDTASNLDTMGLDAIVAYHKSLGVPPTFANIKNSRVTNSNIELLDQAG